MNQDDRETGVTDRLYRTTVLRCSFSLLEPLLIFIHTSVSIVRHHQMWQAYVTVHLHDGWDREAVARRTLRWCVQQALHKRLLM